MSFFVNNNFLESEKTLGRQGHGPGGFAQEALADSSQEQHMPENSDQY
jgi:hypothetical protein